MSTKCVELATRYIPAEIVAIMRLYSYNIILFSFLTQ